MRSPRTLPRILSATEVDVLTGALRTHRDRAMVAAMLLGGLRRCEVLGLRLGDVRAGDKQWRTVAGLTHVGVQSVGLDAAGIDGAWRASCRAEWSAQLG